MSQEIIVLKGKLTKKKFMELPEGAYLASNCCHPNRSPIFAETVVSLEARVEQWKRIKKSMADQRLAYVHENVEAYLNYCIFCK